MDDKCDKKQRRSGDTMLYKLIVLYMLNKVDMPLTANQIINYILEQGYTDYLTMQQTIGELIDDGYITSAETQGSALYNISESGSSTLKMFVDTVSSAIREEIDNYVRENKYKFIEERSITADYTTESATEYRVYLAIHERNQRILELQLVVPNEEIAKNFCHNWKNKSADVYTYALSVLQSSSRKASRD